MARITGGVTGRPAGKLAGLVFGAARSRTGKVVTAREKVDPSNPNTAAQQAQRTKFSEALKIVRAWGPSMYQEDWNRSIGQLPGFQSLMSVLLNNMNSSFVLSLPSVTPLGDLPTENVTITALDPNNVATWTATGTSPATSGDMIQLASTGSTSALRALLPGEGGIFFEDAATRSAGTATLTEGAFDAQDVWVYWFRGAGTAVGLLSPATWKAQTI